MEGGQPRINLNHLKPAANTESKREEPKVRPKKEQVPGPSNGQRRQAKTQDKGRWAPPKRREELRHGRGLLTQGRINAQGRDPRRQKERVRPEAKASGRCNRASEESKTRSRRRGHKPVTNPPQPQKRWRINRHRKRMTNHEGQPRPPLQPTNTWDTVGQKHNHSKVREGQQGHLTCKPSRQHRNWSTLTQGAKPQLPQQASRAGEAQKKKGRAEAQLTSPGKQKDRPPVAWKP